MADKSLQPKNLPPDAALLPGVWASAIVAIAVGVFSAFGGNLLLAPFLAIAAFMIGAPLASIGGVFVFIIAPKLQNKTGMGRRASFVATAVVGALFIAVISAGFLGPLAFMAITYGLPVGILTGLFASRLPNGSPNQKDVEL